MRKSRLFSSLMLSLGLLILASFIGQSCSWCISTNSGSHRHHGAWNSHSSNRGRSSNRIKYSHLYMNVLSDVGDFLTGGKLQRQSGQLVYGEPLGEISNTNNDISTLAVQERPISFTGEDFDVWDIDRKQPYCRVRGAMLHLPGKDKMRIERIGQGVVATLDRKLVALTPTYDILRGNGGEKIGWLEKTIIGLTDTFGFHAEKSKSGGFGPFKPPAAYKLEGDFLDRRFVMKNDKGEVVAKISMDQLVEFDQFNHYQIRIASGMDPILVVACACAIDEEFDEEHKKRREQRKNR